MRIKIKNEELVRVMTFLDGLTAKGKMSLARSRMIDLVKKKNQEYLDERKQIIEAHAEKDVDGQPITKDDGTYELSRKGNAEAGKEIIDLNKDFSVIEYGEYTNRINELVLTIWTAFTTLLGTCLGVSSHQYNKEDEVE